MSQTDTNGQPFDISAEIAALCDKLGLLPKNVAWIRFEPTEVTARVFLTNEDGAKYVVIDADGREGVADETRAFSVRT